MSRSSGWFFHSMRNALYLFQEVDVGSANYSGLLHLLAQPFGLRKLASLLWVFQYEQDDQLIGVTGAAEKPSLAVTTDLAVDTVCIKHWLPPGIVLDVNVEKLVWHSTFTPFLFCRLVRRKRNAKLREHTGQAAAHHLLYMQVGHFSIAEGKRERLPWQGHLFAGGRDDRDAGDG
jgi:hypothetical protein